MFIKRLSKLFICVILIFLLFEKSNAYYMKKGGTPYYIQLVRPILKRPQPNVQPDPPSEPTSVFDNVCPTNDSNTDCEPEQKSEKEESTIFKRKNQIHDCRVNDDDCYEYSYETNKRPVEVGKLDKKILEVLFNMKLLETDMNQEMSDQRLRK